MRLGAKAIPDGERQGTTDGVPPILDFRREGTRRAAPCHRTVETRDATPPDSRPGHTGQSK